MSDKQLIFGLDTTTKRPSPVSVSDYAAHVIDGLSAPSSTNAVVGNIATPTAGTITNIITELAASGYTQLVLRLKGVSGAVTNNPVVYFVVNSADPTTALGVTTLCRFLGVNDEAVIILPSTDPLTSVDVVSAGTITNTSIAWEYR